MPGFIISNYEHNEKLIKCNTTNIVVGEFFLDSFFVKRATLNKFFDDKAFFQDDFYCIVVEGVLLNKTQLYNKYDVDSVHNLVIKMYQSEGEVFFRNFRGSFSGALYIKAEGKWIIYTNHYGDNTVYYSINDGKIVIGSQIRYILNVLKGNNCRISLNENAVYSMLTYGYMHDDNTYANEIKRLPPGHYVVYKGENLKVNKYFDIKPGKYNLSNKSEDEIIDKLDCLFRDAVKLEYEKDNEYGYKHIAQLSGGLDSRMCLWVANELGYKSITCMTFAQSNSLDDTIAREIAKDLSIQILVWPMDSAEHLVHIDEYISMNYGTALYGGIGAEKEILSALDMSQYGLVHTGQIGDVVDGCFLKNKKELDDFSNGGAYSNIMPPQPIDHSQFYDREDYLMYVRGFLGCLSSHIYTRNYTEVASPFLNVDLFEYCLSIPVEMRTNHELYKKWILKKHPQAAEYIWEQLGYRINDRMINIIFRKIKNMIADPYILLRKLGINSCKTRKNIVGMNPYDLWWENNKRFREVYNAYYADNINNKIISDDLKSKIQLLYNSGNTNEKMMAITALGAINYYFEGLIIDEHIKK